MSSTWGERVKISVFGGSHTEAIGITIDGIPAGFAVDLDKILLQMSRRAPGRDEAATPRKESDAPELLCGILDGITTGEPITAIIWNTNKRSRDYESLRFTPRPGHADYTAFVKYGGKNDIRGGGHFSGRLTAPIVFAGALCRQLLEAKGIAIGAHVSSVGQVHDDCFDAVNVCADELHKLSTEYFPVINPAAKDKMYAEIKAAREAGDSIGGTVECAVVGMEAGIGEPMFGGVENKLTSIIYGIPAVKGIEFGAGFALSEMHGSESNDAFYFSEGTVRTATNNMGGILGGITTGMPIILRTAFKPTPSISLPQKTVNLQAGENTEIEIKGRHDPCIVPRAAPVVEAAAAIAIADMLAIEGKLVKQ